MMPEQWEISRVTFYDGLVLAEGWEPFAASGYVVWVKRRLAPQPVRQTVPRPMTTAEREAFSARSREWLK